MTKPYTVCVLGVGNPDCGDDGVGPKLVERLGHSLSPGVTTVKTSGEPAGLIDILSQYHSVILIDAIEARSRPGTIHRFDAAIGPLPSEFISNYSTHGMGVDQAIEMARVLEELPENIVVYGVEGLYFEAGNPMSSEVKASMDELAKRITAEIRALQSPGQKISN